jgi:hypothetical protein
MGTPIANYGWMKPTIGGDATTWGNELNANLDGIDSTASCSARTMQVCRPCRQDVMLPT